MTVEELRQVRERQIVRPPEIVDGACEEGVAQAPGIIEHGARRARDPDAEVLGHVGFAQGP